MGEAVLPGRRAPARGEDGEFASNLKPKGSRVNFGTLKNEQAKPVKKKKKHKVLRRVFLTLLLLILLAGGAVAALYFTGYLNPVMELVGLREPAAEAQPTLEDREAMLAIREASLDQREASLTKRGEELAAREAKLEAEEADRQSVKTFREKLEGMSDEELEDVKRVSAIYAKMDAGEAAAILEGLNDLSRISTILYYMQPAASAAILQKMEAALAADVTTLILN